MTSLQFAGPYVTTPEGHTLFFTGRGWVLAEVLTQDQRDKITEKLIAVGMSIEGES